MRASQPSLSLSLLLILTLGLTVHCETVVEEMKDRDRIVQGLGLTHTPDFLHVSPPGRAGSQVSLDILVVRPM